MKLLKLLFHFLDQSGHVGSVGMFVRMQSTLYS